MNEAQYRQQLLERRQLLEQRISAIDRDIRHEGMTADWSEQAAERENDEVLESLGNSSEQELAMVKAALLRLEEGLYFHCHDCGRQIPTERLDLLPYTAHCIDCAEALEH